MYVYLYRKAIFAARHPLKYAPVAPAKYQKILSFSVGFFCVLGWQTSLAATCFVSRISCLVKYDHS